ncbi:High affinity Ca2+/Mn2+ P-type ATPase-like protein [Coemansia sp. RSA 2440]|nr:High affinity Ca2+/Mn2+ P-type ATPase-like protein [Coemansia sp. RSA 2440]
MYILMDGPPAQSLGVEPVDPEVMKQPPRRRDADIITRQLVTRVFTAASFIVAGTMAIYVSEMQDGEVTARDTSMVSIEFSVDSSHLNFYSRFAYCASEESACSFRPRVLVWIFSIVLENEWAERVILH